MKDTKHGKTFVRRLMGIRDGFVGKASFAEKIHGNAYQIGLPDWWIVTMGHNVHIEIKVGRPSTVGRLLKMCRPRQRLVLMRMGKFRARGFLVCTDGDRWTGVNVMELWRLEDRLVWVDLDTIVEVVRDQIRSWEDLVVEGD